jgi:hypothetical protein
MNATSTSVVTPPTLGRSNLYFLLALAGLVALSIVLAVTSLLGDSPTFDEPLHVTAGVAAWETGDYRLSPEHPPLARLWCTLPVLWQPHAWLPADNAGWVKCGIIECARDFLFNTPGNDPQRLIVAGRLMMVLLLGATVLATYALGRDLFGRSAGLLAAALAALSPSLLAHGRLVTTDLPVTLLVTLTLLTAGGLCRRLTWWRLLAFALSFATLSVAKMNWVFVVPALVAMALIVVARRRPWSAAVRAKRTRRDTEALIGPRSQRAAYALVVAAAALLAVWITIWCVYGLQRYTLVATDAQLETPAFKTTQNTLVLRWFDVVNNADGTPKSGLLPARWIRSSLAGCCPRRTCTDSGARGCCPRHARPICWETTAWVVGPATSRLLSPSRHRWRFWHWSQPELPRCSGCDVGVTSYCWSALLCSCWCISPGR